MFAHGVATTQIKNALPLGERMILKNIKRMAAIWSSFLTARRPSLLHCKKASKSASVSIIGCVKRTGLLQFPDVVAPSHLLIDAVLIQVEQVSARLLSFSLSP